MKKNCYQFYNSFYISFCFDIPVTINIKTIKYHGITRPLLAKYLLHLETNSYTFSVPKEISNLNPKTVLKIVFSHVKKLEFGDINFKL